MHHHHINVAGLIIAICLIILAICIVLFMDRPRDDDVDNYGDDIPPTNRSKWL